MASTDVGIIFQGSTITLDAASVGVITDFEIPENTFKEFRIDGMGQTRECFKRSTKQVGQIFTFTVRLDTKTTLVANDASGAVVVTPPLQDSGSGTNSSYSFNAYVLTAGALTGSQDDTDGVTQTFTMRVDSEITRVVES